MSAPAPADAPGSPVLSAQSPVPVRTARGWTISSVILVVGLLVIAVASAALWLRWDDFMNWSNPLGNAAGVLGLAVSVIGFCLTLLTMWDTQRINQRGHRRRSAEPNMMSRLPSVVRKRR